MIPFSGGESLFGKIPLAVGFAVSIRWKSAAGK
jgi:hypothetical protein